MANKIGIINVMRLYRQVQCIKLADRMLATRNQYKLADNMLITSIRYMPLCDNPKSL